MPKAKPTKKTKKQSQAKLITKNLTAKKTKLTRDGSRAKAMRDAREMMKAAGILFDAGNVLFIVDSLKCVIAFDIPEYKTEARKYAENEKLDFFHIEQQMYREYAALENVMQFIIQGRGREIFLATAEQQKTFNKDKKRTKEIHAVTGGKICSKKIPVAPGQRV